MKRVVSLYLPNWPIDRLRRRLGDAAPPPEAPVVLIGRDRRLRVLTACNLAARALGLRPGMAAAQAHALAPGLAPFDADPAGDADALGRFAITPRSAPPTDPTVWRSTPRARPTSRAARPSSSLTWRAGWPRPASRPGACSRPPMGRPGWSLAFPPDLPSWPRGRSGGRSLHCPWLVCVWTRAWLMGCAAWASRPFWTWSGSPGAP